MFSKIESDKKKFLDQAKAAREERAQDRHREEAAILIQVKEVRNSFGYFTILFCLLYE